MEAPRRSRASGRAKRLGQVRGQGTSCTCSIADEEWVLDSMKMRKSLVQAVAVGACVVWQADPGARAPVWCKRRLCRFAVNHHPVLHERNGPRRVCDFRAQEKKTETPLLTRTGKIWGGRTQLSTRVRAGSTVSAITCQNDVLEEEHWKERHTRLGIHVHRSAERRGRTQQGAPAGVPRVGC